MSQLRIPERGYVLLDTNVLIDTSKYPEEFSTLYKEFEKLHISTVLESTIRFEFLRGISKPSEGDKFLEELFGTDCLLLKPDQNIFDSALQIGGVFKRNDNKQVKIADLLIAAQICKYAKDSTAHTELILATQNHKDFPPVLFERIDDYLVTLSDGSIKTIGFYRFKKARLIKLAI